MEILNENKTVLHKKAFAINFYSKSFHFITKFFDCYNLQPDLNKILFCSDLAVNCSAVYIVWFHFFFRHQYQLSYQQATMCKLSVDFGLNDFVDRIITERNIQSYISKSEAHCSGGPWSFELMQIKML